MADQAEALRQLALQAGGPADRATGRVLLVVGAQPAVGTTTISGHLAVAFRRQGWPTALVDADLDDPGLLSRWAVSARYTLADLTTRRRTIREVLQSGPCGLQLVAGCDRDQTAVHVAGAGAGLASALQSLARTRWVVVDAGRGDIWDDLYHVAHAVLIVTTPDSGCLRQAYARVKTVHAGPSAARLWAVMNRVRDLEAGRRAQQKLVLACDRCLNREICAGAVLPADSQLSEAESLTRPVALHAPASHFGRGLEALAVQLVGEHRGPWGITKARRAGAQKVEKTQFAEREQPIPRPSLFAPGCVKMQ